MRTPPNSSALLSMLGLSLLVSACAGRAGDGGFSSDDDDDATSDDDDATSDDDDDTTDVPFGPENQWSHAMEGDVPDDLGDDTGIGVGEVISDFTLVDQNGDEVQLYQFYGKVIQLILFAEWCGPCRDEEPLVEQTWQELEGDGVVVLAVMFEDYGGAPPEVEDLQNWINDFGSTHPLVAGPGNLDPMLQGGFPTLPVIGRDMRLLTPDNFPFSADALRTYAAQ